MFICSTSYSPSGDGGAGDVDIVGDKLILAVLSAKGAVVNLVALFFDLADLFFQAYGGCGGVHLLVRATHRVVLAALVSRVHLDGVVAHLQHIVCREVLVGFVVGRLLAFTCNK